MFDITEYVDELARAVRYALTPQPVNSTFVVTVCKHIMPRLAAVVPDEPTGRLFRLDDTQRDLVLAGLYRALFHAEVNQPPYGLVNRAALDIGMWLENTVSEHWRLEAGGKPRD